MFISTTAEDKRALHDLASGSEVEGVGLPVESRAVVPTTGDCPGGWLVSSYFLRRTDLHRSNPGAAKG